MDLQNIIYLIAYIIIYSFFGWLLESVYKTIYCRKPVNSGFLIGPLCPIYGFGAAIMYLCLNNLKGNIIAIFFAGMILLSVWEYIAGLLLEKLFKTKYWDYSNNFLNFQGRICLKNSIIWGMLGVGFTELVHPLISGVIQNIPLDILIHVEIVAVILIIVDAIVSVIRITDTNAIIDKFMDITDTIKLKMEELKTLTGKANEKSRESINKLIEELKQKQESLKESAIRRTARIRLAFPSMKSEKISKLLNKKIDISDILKNDKK